MLTKELPNPLCTSSDKDLVKLWPGSMEERDSRLTYSKHSSLLRHVHFNILYTEETEFPLVTMGNTQDH